MRRSFLALLMILTLLELPTASFHRIHKEKFIRQQKRANCSQKRFSPSDAWKCWGLSVQGKRTNGRETEISFWVHVRSHKGQFTSSLWQASMKPSGWEMGGTDHWPYYWGGWHIFRSKYARTQLAAKGKTVDENFEENSPKMVCAVLVRTRRLTFCFWHAFSTAVRPSTMGVTTSSSLPPDWHGTGCVAVWITYVQSFVALKCERNRRNSLRISYSFSQRFRHTHIYIYTGGRRNTENHGASVLRIQDNFSCCEIWRRKKPSCN